MQNNFDPLCYKLHYDRGAVKISEILTAVNGLGNFVIHDGEMYVFMKNGKNKQDLNKKFPKQIAGDVYCERIYPEQCIQQDNFLSIWFREQYEAAFLEFVKTERREQLNKAVQNIERAKERIRERIQNEKEE